jgi:oxygen-independent coproporphyrinogen III oxidase
MAGIYIHIPYCRQACHYCNFHFSVYQGNKEAFLECLHKEIELQAGFFTDEDDDRPRLDTIYLGGGTPSILHTTELLGIFEKLGAHYRYDADTEITLEANPDDLTYEKLLSLLQTPVNRLSIGIQSFHYPDLEYMNRIHSPVQALQAIANAQKCGFGNLTIDLIYGTPTMSDRQWEDNILKVIEMEIPHISAYALTVEPKTALDVFIRRGKATPVDEAQSARQFEMLMTLMEKYGYQHYEISNFARPGHLSRHNLSYWTGKPYLGLGPSAHSYRGRQRWWNIANTSKYIQSVREHIIPAETEILTPAQQYDEYLMTTLRTMWGCGLAKVERLWGRERMELLRRQAQKFMEQGLMQETGGHLMLTPRGRLFADGIAAELFWVD